MSKANRKCKIDLKEYKYCLSCYEDRNKPTWMSMFCCERCKNVFDALVKYNLGKETKDNTKKILSGLDLSDLETFEDEIKTQIKELISSSKTENVEECNSEESKTKEKSKKILNDKLK